MNVIDSSAWLEYFANGPNASFFARAIEQTDDLVVPSLTLYEVFKKVLQQADEGNAFQAVAVMQQGTASILMQDWPWTRRASASGKSSRWRTALFWRRRRPPKQLFGHRMKISRISPACRFCKRKP